MPAAETGATMAAHGVDFVNKDDAGRVLFALLEKVADPARANAHEHLDKIRSGNGEERNARFARDGARK